MSRRRMVVIAVVALLVVGAGATAAAALAGIPGPDGTFTACYDSKGVLKVVPSGTTKCPKGWTGPVYWNQQGQPGATGATGPMGPQGQPGPAGTPGWSGFEKVAVTTEDFFHRGSPIRDYVASEYAKCPLGKEPVSGGFVLFPVSENGRDPSDIPQVTTSVPSVVEYVDGQSVYGWVVTVWNPTLAIVDFNVWAVCANVT